MLSAKEVELSRAVIQANADLMAARDAYTAAYERLSTAVTAQLSPEDLAALGLAQKQAGVAVHQANALFEAAAQALSLCVWRKTEVA